MSPPNMRELEDSIVLRWVIRTVAGGFLGLIVWVAKDIAQTVDNTAGTVQEMAVQQAVYGEQARTLTQAVGGLRMDLDAVKNGIADRTRDRFTKTEAREAFGKVDVRLDDHEHRIRGMERSR